MSHPRVAGFPIYNLKSLHPPIGLSRCEAASVPAAVDTESREPDVAANLSQLTYLWTGFAGAPGYSSFYLASVDDSDVQNFHSAIRTFFNAIHGEISINTAITPPSSYRTLDHATGTLGGILPVTTPGSAITGSGNNSQASPAGASVNWLTSTAATHKLVVGRTYLVPLGANAYQSDGSLVDADKAVIAAAAGALVATMTPSFVVWRRPVAGAGGGVAPVTAARVNDRVAMLRSRRA